MNIFRATTFFPGRYNNYLIAGNICNAFAIGEIGSTDDFFLVGAEPTEESSFPLLTGNVLDSEGNVLFRLVRNVLVLNPGMCSKILGNQIGYEIHDSLGKLIFKVKTEFVNVPQIGNETFVTTIAANFYNKSGELVFSANSGEENEQIESGTKTVFGYSGRVFGMSNLNEIETSFARVVFDTQGTINELLTGKIENQEIILDGKVLIDVEIRNCRIGIGTGIFAPIRNVSLIQDDFYTFGGVHNALAFLSQNKQVFKELLSFYENLHNVQRQ